MQKSLTRISTQSLQREPRLFNYSVRDNIWPWATISYIKEWIMPRNAHTHMVTHQALLSQAAASYSLRVQRSTDPWQLGPRSSLAWLTDGLWRGLWETLACQVGFEARWKWSPQSLIRVILHLSNFSFVFAVTLPCDVLFANGYKSTGGSVSLTLLMHMLMNLHMPALMVGGLLCGSRCKNK